MSFEKTNRLKELPPYLFAQIDKAKRKAKAEGRDIIDLGVGDPDQPTPRRIVGKLYDAAQDPVNQKYALDAGMSELRKAIASWYENRFGVTLDPDTEILPLIGSKEGIAHLPLAVINPGDVALIPEPCYPAYRSATLFAGGVPEYLPLLEENDFRPIFAKIPQDTLDKAKLLFLNYPNNPTAATVELPFFKRAVDCAKNNNFVIAQDAAYSEISFNGYTAPSILQLQGAKDVSVEFHSLSKTFNMTGWRIGWVCGNKDIIAALTQVKANIDSGIFQAIQVAAIEALSLGPKHVIDLKRLYTSRRNQLIRGLKKAGWRITNPQATFYVWAKLPEGHTDSMAFAKLLLDKADIIVTPGIGFGPSGKDYVRIALTVPRSRVEDAVARIAKIL